MFSVCDTPLSPWQPAQISVALALPAAISAACAIGTADRLAAMMSRLPIRDFRLWSLSARHAQRHAGDPFIIVGIITTKGCGHHKAAAALQLYIITSCCS